MKWLLCCVGWAVSLGIAVLLVLGLERAGVHLGSLASIALGYLFGTVGFYAGLFWGEDIEARRRFRQWNALQERMDRARLKDIAEGNFDGRNVWREYLRKDKP